MGALRTSINWKHNGLEQKLHTMWFAEGLSGGAIAKKLGMTRGAILGKLHRMGWTGGRAGKGNSRAKNISSGRIVRTKFQSHPAPRTYDSLKDIAIRESDPPEHERVTFENLERHHCRWPVGDKFCGRQRADKTSYCPDHDGQAHRTTYLISQCREDQYAALGAAGTISRDKARNLQAAKIFKRGGAS